MAAKKSKAKSELDDRGKLVVISMPVSQLEPNPWNSNKMKKRQRAALIATFEKDGYMQPIAIRPLDREDRQYIEPAVFQDAYLEMGQNVRSAFLWQIIDGQHRWEVAVELGFESMDCVVIPCDEALARRMTETFNLVRGTAVPELQAANFASLNHDFGVSVEELSQLTALSMPRIEELITLNDLASDESYADVDAEAKSDERFVKLVFEMPESMAATVQRAIDVAKREGETNSDNQALEYVCIDYLSGAGEREDELEEVTA